MAVALALYVYDSSVLLFANEALLLCTGANRWRAMLANRQFLLAGRSLHVLNPLLPHRPAFRLTWNHAAMLTPTAVTAWSEMPAALKTIAPLVVLATTALFGVLPLGLFTAFGIKAVITGLCLLYGSLGTALWRLYRVRAQVDMTGRRFAAFAFECLACPPFGVNMIRRITLAQKIAEPFPVAAHRLLNAPAWESIRTQGALP